MHLHLSARQFDFMNHQAWDAGGHLCANLTTIKSLLQSSSLLLFLPTSALQLLNAAAAAATAASAEACGGTATFARQYIR